MSDNPQSALSDWPLDPEVIYLNHGAFGSCPRPVQETADALRRRFERAPMQFVMRDAESLIDAARVAAAPLMGADGEDLVFVQNATTAVCTVLASLPVRPGDELLVTMSLPAALRFMSGLLPGGLPALRDRNHDLVVRARALLMDALDIQAPCPAEMLGAMATLQLPATTSMSAPVLYEALWRKHRIEAPVFDWPSPGRPMLRVCAQIYNDLQQYQQLADAVSSELG